VSLTERTWTWLHDNEYNVQTLRDDTEAREIFLGEFLSGKGLNYDQVENTWPTATWRDAPGWITGCRSWATALPRS
jgi:hypothetical protein